jgi:hypothetical protein
MLELGIRPWELERLTPDEERRLVRYRKQQLEAQED